MEILAFIAFFAFAILGVMLIASLFVKKLRKKYLLLGLCASFILFMVGVLGSDEFTKAPAEQAVVKNSDDTEVKTEEVKEEVKTEEVSATPVVEKEEKKEVDWESEVKKISETDGISKTEKFDLVSVLAKDYNPSETDIDNFEITILNAYSSGEYLSDIDNDLYMLSNIFMSNVIERSYDDSLNNPMDSFAFDFWQNSKYVYRGADTVDSESVKSNEQQMEKALNKM